MVLCLIMEIIASGIPEALCRIRTLDGGQGLLPGRGFGNQSSDRKLF